MLELEAETKKDALSALTNTFELARTLILLEAADTISAVVLKNAECVAESSLKTMFELEALTKKEAWSALTNTLELARTLMLLEAADTMSAVVVKKAEWVAESSLKTMFELEADTKKEALSALTNTFELANTLILLEAADTISAVVVKNAEWVAESSLKTMLELEADTRKEALSAFTYTLEFAKT